MVGIAHRGRAFESTRNWQLRSDGAKQMQRPTSPGGGGVELLTVLHYTRELPRNLTVAS